MVAALATDQVAALSEAAADAARAAGRSSGAARSFHDHHRARGVDQFVATSDDPWLVPAELAHRHRVTSQLGLRRLAFQREQRPDIREQSRVAVDGPGSEIVPIR